MGREINPFVIKRKNFLFAGSQEGARAPRLHFSLIRFAKQHKLDSYQHYVEISKAIAHCEKPESSAPHPEQQQHAAPIALVQHAPAVPSAISSASIFDTPALLIASKHSWCTPVCNPQHLLKILQQFAVAIFPVIGSVALPATIQHPAANAAQEEAPHIIRKHVQKGMFTSPTRNEHSFCRLISMWVHALQKV